MIFVQFVELLIVILFLFFLKKIKFLKAYVTRLNVNEHSFTGYLFVAQLVVIVLLLSPKRQFWVGFCVIRALNDLFVG